MITKYENEKPIHPYELALKAKEKGFNEPCLTYWEGQDLEIPIHCVSGYCNNPNNPQNTSAPIYQQIIDWFREKHTIDIVYIPAIGWQVQTYNKNMNKFTFYKEDMPEDRYSESRIKAIEEAFKLI